MADSEYTKGFNAGLMWREAEIVNALENAAFEQPEPISKDFANGAVWAVKETITLIKGQKK
jgi:hypothetical protein